MPTCCPQEQANANLSSDGTCCSIGIHHSGADDNLRKDELGLNKFGCSINAC